MRELGLRHEWDLNTIADAMCVNDAANHIFAHEGHFPDADAAREHLGRWLGAPTNIDRLLNAPLGSIRPRRSGLVGDVRIDAVLAGMLDSIGVDPRAYAVAILFDADSHFIFGDVDFTPLRIESLTGTDVEISGSVELNARAEDLSFEIRRIEIMNNLPETVVTACIGNPLRRIVSHPQLDHMDLVVENVEERGNATRIFYRPVEMVVLRDWKPAMHR